MMGMNACRLCLENSIVQGADAVIGAGGTVAGGASASHQWAMRGRRTASPSGRTRPKEGFQVAWGVTEQGERVLLAVALAMREPFEDWPTLGPDVIGRGLERRC